VRALVLTLLLAPFAILAAKDFVFHRRERRPSVPEELVHLVLGGLQVAVVVQAYRADLRRLLAASVLVGLVGCVDEFAFHRGLPAAESDLHAKAHLALFAFVAVAAFLATAPDLGAFARAVLEGERS
jgi:hypothetical protein